MSDPRDLRLLEALRGDRRTPAPDAAKAHIAERLAIGLSLDGRDDGARSPANRPPQGDTPPRGLSAVSSRMVTGLVAAFVAGAAVGAVLVTRVTPPVTPAQIVYVDRPARPATASPITEATPPIAGATSTGTETSSAAAPSTSSGGPSSRPRWNQLDAERALLDVARAALVNGDTDAALGALDRHARTFGHPLLGEERDAMWIQTLVRAGHYEEARSRAEVFRRRTPQSLLLPAVDAAIASIP